MSARVEVCADSVQACRAALQGGAARVELCAGMSEGGTTPSAGLLFEASRAGIEVVVLVRPRAGDFLYDEHELAAMRRDIEVAKAAGARGVALGVLTAEGDVDRARTAELAALARPLDVCFHRAFDAARDPAAALEILLDLGIDRVLTSGGAARAEDGLARIAQLVLQAEGLLGVVPAGGVRAHNAAAILHATGARELHCSARTPRPSPMRHANPALRLGAGAAQGEYELLPTDEALVRAVVAAVR